MSVVAVVSCNPVTRPGSITNDDESVLSGITSLVSNGLANINREFNGSVPIMGFSSVKEETKEGPLTSKFCT